MLHRIALQKIDKSGASGTDQWPGTFRPPLSWPPGTSLELGPEQCDSGRQPELVLTVEEPCDSAGLGQRAVWVDGALSAAGLCCQPLVSLGGKVTASLGPSGGDGRRVRLGKYVFSNLVVADLMGKG